MHLACYIPKSKGPKIPLQVPSIENDKNIKVIKSSDKSLVKKESNTKEKFNLDTFKTKKEKLRTKLDNSLKHLEYDQNLAIAYLARKFPESFNISLRLILEVKKKFPLFKPLTFLDFGAGLAPSSWAFSSIYEDSESIISIEPNIYLNKLGKYLSQDIPNINWMDSLLQTTGLTFNKFDMVMCSYMLEEVTSPQEREIIVKSLYEKVEDDGILIFVLPGSPMGFRFILDIRDIFISKSREECNIIAPCPHHFECPLENSPQGWCRFEQIFPRYKKDILPKLPSEKTLIKSRFSYLIIKKGKSIQTRSEAKTSQEESIIWPRIIVPIKKKGRHSILYLCNEQGNYEKRIVRRSEGERMWIRCSKRLKWGDQWWFPLVIKKKYLRDRIMTWMKKK